MRAGGENNDDTYTLDISYGSEHNRIWQKFNNSITDETITKRYFNTIYEKIIEQDGNEKQLHYLTAPNGLFAIFTIQNDEVENINYILKDHLGSINYILDENGTVEQEMNFDAWGRRRNAQTWTYNNVPTNFMFDRGYTMHEHLNAFKLINMNGRMYDPIVARFLSPDPFVQMPEYSQNYNRYSYVFNNPLRFTDPSGFIVGGDSTEIVQDNTFNYDISWLFNNLDPNGGDDEATSFSTDYMQFGKSKIPNGVDNPDLLEQSKSKLKNRDNSDQSGGGLTWSEAKANYQFGGGARVNVALSSIDLSRVSLSDFNDRGLATIRLDSKHFSSANDALVHGTITLQLTGTNTAKIALNSGLV